VDTEPSDAVCCGSRGPRAIAISLGPGERTRLQHDFVEEIARDRQAICFCASVQSGRLAELVGTIVEMDEWARITALMKWERGLLRLEAGHSLHRPIIQSFGRFYGGSGALAAAMLAELLIRAKKVRQQRRQSRTGVHLKK
jgi:hypothetical protein